VRLAAESKHVRIFLNLDCPALIVSGDAVRLQQVFWNLLANAVKFTPRGGLIEVNLMVADGFCTVTVSDSGRGIEPEFLPHVFERFRQEDSGMTRQFGGLGLGLAIVRHLVELHGGEVGATSHGRNLGSEFTVRLALSAQTP
jgi:signal transduction histidine kinase